VFPSAMLRTGLVVISLYVFIASQVLTFYNQTIQLIPL
jgi:hypothetical protein